MDNRLTYMHKDGYGVLKDFLDPCEAITKLATYEDTGLSPAEVAEIAKAKDEGRLVELPCKVGDTVYEIFKSFKNPIHELKIRSLDHLLIKYTCFGYSLFLTRAEAEAALRAQEGGSST